MGLLHLELLKSNSIDKYNNDKPPFILITTFNMPASSRTNRSAGYDIYDKEGGSWRRQGTRPDRYAETTDYPRSNGSYYREEARPQRPSFNHPRDTTGRRGYSALDDDSEFEERYEPRDWARTNSYDDYEVSPPLSPGFSAPPPRYGASHSRYQSDSRARGEYYGDARPAHHPSDYKSQGEQSYYRPTFESSSPLDPVEVEDEDGTPYRPTPSRRFERLRDNPDFFPAVVPPRAPTPPPATNYPYPDESHEDEHEQSEPARRNFSQPPPPPSRSRPQLGYDMPEHSSSDDAYRSRYPARNYDDAPHYRCPPPAADFGRGYTVVDAPYQNPETSASRGPASYDRRRGAGGGSDGGDKVIDVEYRPPPGEREYRRYWR